MSRAAGLKMAVRRSFSNSATTPPQGWAARKRFNQFSDFVFFGEGVALGGGRFFWPLSGAVGGIFPRPR